MSTFTVRVRTPSDMLIYPTTGTDSVAVMLDAIDRYGVCAITVVPSKE